jgi:hypothetical protein
LRFVALVDVDASSAFGAAAASAALEDASITLGVVCFVGAGAGSPSCLRALGLQQWRTVSYLMLAAGF